MNCPSCNKFASLETQEPELQTEEFDADTGTFSSEVRLVRNSGCCGDEMKEASFSFEGEMPKDKLKAHQGAGHELSAEFNTDIIEEGGGRYAKSYYGVVLTIDITCSCQKPGDNPIHSESFDDKVSAGSMEELC